MKEFFDFARRMVYDRSMLIAAIVCAVISAVGLGVGMMSMIPAVKLIIGEEGAEGGSLPKLGERFNEAGRELMGVPIRIPQWMIDTVPDGRLEGVLFIVVFIALLTILGATFNFVHQYLSITVAARTVAHARMALFRKALFMPLVRVNARGPSEFVARIGQDSAAVQKGLIALMSKGVLHSTQAIVLLVVAVFVGRSLTIAAIVILPIFIVFLRKLGKVIRRGRAGALRYREDLLRIATESIQGLRSVKANTGEARTTERFDVVNREVVRQELRARLARALSSPVVETVAVFAIGALVVVSAREIINGRLTIDRFGLALGALAVAGSKFKILAGLVNEVQAASAPAQRMLQILDEPLEEEEDATRPALARHARSIRIEGAALTYPGADQPAIRDIDLEIRHGTRLAVVGPNGCGKTTLLGLIPRLLMPNEGRVLIDDVDLTTISLASLRRQVAVVAQETFLFRGTIAENIRFGTEDATRGQIVDAARRSHAHDFISRLPDAYDADIAECGASLSGGQRQRLAIARAILREPSILILDEATSQIDAESEAHINAAIKELCRGRTILLIAHRLATVLDADRIVVMDRGRIVDQGRHDELLGRCELYRRLSQTQLISAAG